MSTDSKRFRSFPCPYPSCDRTLNSSSGRTRHYNSAHKKSMPLDDEPSLLEADNKTTFHLKLNALPCDKEGKFLFKFSKPSPHEPLDAKPDNPFHPFPSRLGFDWVHHHFVDVQSSIAQTNRALDLWQAALIDAGSNASVPWSSAEELKATIDSIQEGDIPWKTVQFRYSGPLPPGTPPKWMMETYELCMRDSRLLLHQQLRTTDFKDKFNPVAYRQFNQKGSRVYSNLMSGNWAWKQSDIIAQDPGTHGAMFVPVVAGSDKTTVSVATGNQEYHPVYQSPGNLTNIARRSHGNGLLPVAFLPIPKTSQRQRKRPEFQRFIRQIYHACLARVFAPLKDGMTKPDIVHCPDGHYRRVIYGLGPYIADYPEQVLLAGIVQNWCPKGDSLPNNLDDPEELPRSHEKTDFLINSFDPGILWDDYGIRHDVVPFTHGFPRADIHELLSPDLLHQLIKGTFKDHLVTWIMEYLRITYGQARALQIIQDIDPVPAYPGLRRFKDGRDFKQWTGDDSKALMKVYLAAIAGHIPSKMVQCVAAFMEICYTFRQDAITHDDLQQTQFELDRFYETRTIFIESGVRTSISLPRQHALKHFTPSIRLFGSPNGLCSSITESKHIRSVKEPWRRSNHYNALPQMLCTITRMEKMEALRSVLARQGLLVGTTTSYMAQKVPEETESDDTSDDISELQDVSPVLQLTASSSVFLAETKQRSYPSSLQALAAHIHQPKFPIAFLDFLHLHRHPNAEPIDAHDLARHVHFDGKIRVFHSAIAQYHAPSDICGAGGMSHERIRSNPAWYNSHNRQDTVLVVMDESKPGMLGMLVARVLLFFSFYDSYRSEEVLCALVTWFIPKDDAPDPETGMWVVAPEYQGSVQPVQVIHLDTIARGIHLLPVYGKGYLPEDFVYTMALDSFKSFFVNHFIDHHAHEFLSQRNQ
ncbi:hypothetical protein C8J56DRAFT_809850 [Mycena floridula]|nr:hypothetical protein C8J56DRAFT_809850 [Mycena floridula]